MYIGTHLIPKLLSTGREVTVLGRKKTLLQELPEGVSYVSGNFGQCDLITRLLDQHQEVIHLAYAAVPNSSFENPLADLMQMEFRDGPPRTREWLTSYHG